MRSSISRVGEEELRHSREAARFTRPTATALAALLVAVSYYVGSEVGFAIRFPSIPTSIVWPPNSILMAALMLAPPRRWWAFLLATLVAHLLVQSQTAIPPSTMLLLFSTNACMAALGAYAVRRLCGGPPRFGYMRDVVVFFVFAVFAAPFVTTFPDAAAVVITKWGDNFSLVWQARFLSNALTVLTLTPAIIMWAVNGRGWLRAASPRRVAEAGLLALGLGVTYAFAHSESPFGPSFVPAKLYAPLPFLIWAALRFGAGGVCTSLLAVLLISVSYAIGGSGPFTSQSPAADVVGLQLFLIALSVPIMMLAAVTEERRRAAEALKESEARNRAILRAAPDLMFLQTRDGVFLDFHARDTKELYVPPEQFIGKSVRDVLPPEVAERVLDSFRIAGESGEPQIIEYALTMEGEERYYEARIVRSNGHVLSVVRDLTERRQAEEALHQIEMRFRATFEQAAVGVAHISLDGRLLLINRKLCDIVGYSPEELLPKTYEDITYPEDLDAELETVRRLLAGETETCSLEKRYVRKDGSAVWANLTVSLVRDEAAGEPSYFIAIVEDISARKLAEEALRESERRFRTMADATPIMVWMSGPDKLCTYFSKGWLDFTGRSMEEELGNGWAESVHPEDFDRCLETYTTSFDARQPFSMEYHLRRHDGEYRWVFDTGVPLYSPGGAFLGYIGSCLDLTERKHAEDALKESENQVRLFVEHTPVAVAMFDREMRYLLTSRRWLKDNNLGEQDIIGRSHYEVVPDVPERWREGHRRCLAGAVERCEEDIFPHPNGTLDWVRWEIRPWYTAGGEIGGIIMFSEMITERKQAEEALRESESRLLLAQQAARVGTWEWDVATGEAVWSEMVWHLLGLEPGDGASNFERFIEFIHPKDRERALRKNREALAGGEEYDNEYRIVRRDGGVLWLSSKGRVTRSAEGRPERMIGVNIDITERKRAEEALRESEERFRNMANNAPVVIWVTEPDGSCSFASQTWRDLTGRPPEAGLGFGWAECVHPDDRARTLAAFLAANERREAFRLDYRLQGKDDAFLWVIVSGVPRFSSQGEFLGYIGSVIDITERKRAEQALEQLTGSLLQLQDEERRRLARELHDTTAQNLLAIVLNLETLVRMASTLPKDFSDAVLECQSLCEQTQAEIRTLSYLLHPPMLDEAGLLLALEWFIDGFSRRSGIHVDFVAPPDFRRLPPRMETALFRVVQESLTNVYRHSGSTTAEVSLERAGGEVSLRVRDRGRGVTAASGDEADSHARQAEALGVGISGMRERLRQLGGHLEVRSGGAGTVVTAVLPLGKGEDG